MNRDRISHTPPPVPSSGNPLLILPKKNGEICSEEPVWGGGVQRMDEVGEHQRHDHQQVRNALVNRRPCMRNRSNQIRSREINRAPIPTGGVVKCKPKAGERTHRRWWAPGRGPAHRRRPAWRRRRRAPRRWRDPVVEFLPWQQLEEHRRDEEQSLSLSLCLYACAFTPVPPLIKRIVSVIIQRKAQRLSLSLSTGTAGPRWDCYGVLRRRWGPRTCTTVAGAVCCWIRQSGIPFLTAGPGWLRCLCRHLIWASGWPHKCSTMHIIAKAFVFSFTSSYIIIILLIYTHFVSK